MPTLRDFRVRPRAKRALFWTGVGVLSLILLGGLTLSISNWNFARGSVATIIASKLDRDVSIDGDLTAHLLSWYPQVTVEQLRIGNPAWTDDEPRTEPFAAIDRILLAIDLRALFTGDLMFEVLEVDHPKVVLIRNQNGRSNFDFGYDRDAASSSEQRKLAPKSNALPKFPPVKSFTMYGGELYVNDAVHKLKFSGKVEANEDAKRTMDEPFRLRGAGTLNEEPFALDFKGGPLVNIKADESYSFDADVIAGKTRGVVKGAFERPFDLASLTADLNLKGENLAHLYYLTGLALPFTPPYRLQVSVRSAERFIQLTSIDGNVGESDVAGRASVDLTGERPKFVAHLTSRSLNLADLSPAFGKGIPVDPDTGKARDSIAPGALPADKLLPTYEFEFDRLRTMDAELTLKAASIQTEKVPMEGVEINLRLDDGVLQLDPVAFELPQGKMAGSVHIDARQAQAKTKMDVRVSNVNLDQFKGKEATVAPLKGDLHARAQLTGVGNSVRDFAANADGQLSGVVPSGEIRKAFAELTGINVARGLGLLLAKNEERAAVRCGAATFRIEDGKANVEQIVVDTESVLIEGEGEIDLGAETLDLEIMGKPKKLRLVRLRAPVTLTGTLRKPDIGVDAGDAAKQVGIAGIVGAILSPLTAALAFIDPGLAEDANCAALLAEAQKAMPKSASIR